MGPEEMALWIKLLLFNCEDQSSDPSSHIKAEQAWQCVITHTHTIISPPHLTLGEKKET